MLFINRVSLVAALHHGVKKRLEPNDGIWQSHIIWNLIFFCASMADRSLMEEMRDFYVRMHRLMNDELKAQGVSLAQLKLLLFIDRRVAVRAVDISDAFAFAPRTVTEAIDTLERDGLVRRDPDPNDRRAKHISVTDAGRSAIADAEPCRNAIRDRIFSALAPADEEELLRILAILNDRLIAIGVSDPYGKPAAK
ncbi:MAG: MarR family transcriptional regulator [Sphingobium sp.]|nr:MarR family transcriptional regulator [Sphingobium sp.]